jgi:hypothetical protein
LLEDASLLFLFEPEGLAFDIDRQAMVEQPVKDGGGDDGVTKHDVMPRGLIG